MYQAYKHKQLSSTTRYNYLEPRNIHTDFIHNIACRFEPSGYVLLFEHINQSARAYEMIIYPNIKHLTIDAHFLDAN